MNNANPSRRGENLTATQFDSLLRRLHSDRECAGEKYEDIRWQMTKFFEWNCGCLAEDLVDETFDRVARRLQELEIPDVVSFAWGVARNVRQEALKRASRMIPIPDQPDEGGFPVEVLGTENQIHEKMELEWQRKCLLTCIQHLPLEDSKLFLAYYHPEGDLTEARQNLARDLELTANALRVRINRLRDRVEKCVARHALSASKSAACLARGSGG